MTTEALLTEILSELRKLNAAANRRAAVSGPTVAPDSDLDGQYGNELIKFEPRDWTGQKHKGQTMNECEPEYLDKLAEAFDYFAAKNDTNKAVDNNGHPKSKYDRRSAARARGWAKRLREGWKPSKPSKPADFSDADFGGDESEPF